LDQQFAASFEHQLKVLSRLPVHLVSVFDVFQQPALFDYGFNHRPQALTPVAGQSPNVGQQEGHFGVQFGKP
jgi:hypothetical protein